jgi:hypothetical protein
MGKGEERNVAVLGSGEYTRDISHTSRFIWSWLALQHGII